MEMTQQYFQAKIMHLTKYLHILQNRKRFVLTVKLKQFLAVSVMIQIDIFVLLIT